MNKKILLVFLVIIVFASGCTENSTGKVITDTSAPKIIKETSTSPEVYFCPQDNCEKQLADLINSANKSVHCALYDLDLDDVINALKKDTDMKLVVDKKNTENLDGLSYVKNDFTKQLTHNKFCVIDNKIISTGSFNPTERGNSYNNNNLIIISSKYLAENYESEFQELYNKEFGSGEKVKYPVIYLNNKKIENYFCPEDSCSEHIISTLNNAKTNIYFMTFTFTHTGIADILIKKHNEVDVKGVFEKFTNQWTQYYNLKDDGINVKWDGNKYNMHHKVFIIDNKTVITGSFNPTKSADERNDENILIIHDKEIAEKFLEEFEIVWNDGVKND